MKKYRTILKNGKYYPQSKVYFFFWVTFSNFGYTEVYYKTLEESEEFISNFIERNNKPTTFEYNGVHDV